MKEKRSISDVHLKLGIDGGGGFLKVCLSVQASIIDNTSSERKRTRYIDGISIKKFKDSGVKKIFILAAVTNPQENYDNVKHLFSALGINYFKGTIATDLKLANILVGIMQHSSSYPCTYCFARSDQLNSCGQLRSSKNVYMNYQNWLNEGKGIKEDAKNTLIV